MGIPQAHTPEKYHVDERCIGCGICSEIAPHSFRFDHAQGAVFLRRQPESVTQQRLCTEAMDICPVNAIGVGGRGGDLRPA